MANLDFLLVTHAGGASSDDHAVQEPRLRTWSRYWSITLNHQNQRMRCPTDAELMINIMHFPSATVCELERVWLSGFSESERTSLLSSFLRISSACMADLAEEDVALLGVEVEHLNVSGSAPLAIISMS